MKFNTPIKVAIIENDEPFRSHLARLLAATKGLRCSGLHSSALRALKQFSVSLPEIILMDIHLPDMNGVECVRRIKELCPDKQVLVLTNINDFRVVFETFSAGAVGYLLKSSTPDQIVTAIQEVYHGGSPMTGSIARQVVGLLYQTTVPEQGYRNLSLREQQVLDLLAEGCQCKEVADRLKISPNTAHTHIRHIYRKLQVTCRTDAVTLHLRNAAIWQLKLRTQPKNASPFNHFKRSSYN